MKFPGQGRDGTQRRAGFTRAITIGLAIFMSVPASPAQSVDGDTERGGDSLEDATRFAALLEATAYRPSERELADGYLARGTTALQAFAEDRIGSVQDLGRALRVLEPDYRRAVDRCLPAARALEQELPDLLDATRTALGLEPGAPVPRVAVLFGAGRSAGTVLGESVILALEVVCRFDTSQRDPLDLLRGFLVHEVVHYHQLRWQRPESRDSLLRQAMLEGYADLVTEAVVGEPTPPAGERDRYGRMQEARLWTAFRRDMAGQDLAPWMYGPGRPGEPPDLGYWIGLRISETLLDGPGSKAEMRRALLRLEDPFELLERSAYGEAFGPP